VTSSTEPVRFTLNFRVQPYFGRGVTIKRRVVGRAAWSIRASGYLSDTYTDADPSLRPGLRYEYEVSREGISGASSFLARILVSAAQPAYMMENRGKVLLVVDSTVAPDISGPLQGMVRNLIGDGWSVVVKTDAPRHDHRFIACSVGYRTDPVADAANQAGREAVKQFIEAHPDARGIILMGHVTIPFSGLTAADGHPEHAGAWVADAWYGHSGRGWTDAASLPACVTYPWNSNFPDDGKFDQDVIPHPLEYQKFVGRIDFARLPAFGTGEAPSAAEISLLNNYLKKNHDYRMKVTPLDSRAVVYSTLPFSYADQLVYLNAFRNMSPVLGSAFERIVIGDPFHQRSNAYLWGFLSGFGGPDQISQGAPGSAPLEGPFLMHTTSELAAVARTPAALSEAKVGFYFLYGSYFGDWNFQDNLMRAALATPQYGLAAVGGANWQFHGLALGEPIGEGVKRTINDHLLEPNVRRDLSFLGDPTLRINVIAPPRAMRIDRGILRWEAGEPNCTYYVYHAPALDGTFKRIAGPLSYPNALVPPAGVVMVRAAKPVTSGSATYLNFSQGTFRP
jgi:hypothetical protein